ncbi:MAG: helix-turn-helix transcriptional regulator [Pseudonocardiales bacterium]|nr:helix-turn-helix transcriptional regulator [Pseudonocardiales bacterium]
MRHHDVTGGCGPALPAAFYDDPQLTAALARLDFGPVFRRVSAEKHWSQTVLGGLLGLDQAAISKIENGRRRLTEATIIIRVANVLGIPAGKLGFRHGVTVELTGQEGSWVEQRRDFMDQVAGLAFGVAVDPHRLMALFPQAEPTGTRHLGAADIEAIEQATVGYVRQDHAEGSGMIRDTAVFHLRSTLPLLDAQVPAELRPRLMIAIAWLATITGWMSFDVTQHDAARQFWLIGLGLARGSEHPLGSDLSAFLLYDMAAQARHLDRPDEALKLVHFGEAVAVGAPALSPSTAGLLARAAASAHAVRGDAAGCDRALGQMQECFARIDLATRLPWGGYLDDATLAALQGGVHYALAQSEGDPAAASRAVALLHPAVNHFGPDRALARAIHLPSLAGAHALAGDVDTAVSVGHQAIDAVTSVHSPRAYAGLHRLHTVLKPLHTSPGVAELRERLTTTAT